MKGVLVDSSRVVSTHSRHSSPTSSSSSSLSHPSSSFPLPSSSSSPLLPLPPQLLFHPSPVPPLPHLLPSPPPPPPPPHRLLIPRPQRTQWLLRPPNQAPPCPLFPALLPPPASSSHSSPSPPLSSSSPPRPPLTSPLPTPHSPLLIFPLSFFSTLPLLYLAVFCSLSLPTAILESSYSLHLLRRSAHLVRGMRPITAFLYLLFAPGIVLIVWQCGLGEVRAFAGWREALPVIARTVFGLALTAFLLLYWMVSNVVMYLYCKAVHGELPAEIAEEFAWEYVCLPFDEEKVPHVISVVRQ